MSDKVGEFKGLFSKRSEQKWGKIIDELKEWDNKWVEMSDSWAGKYGVRSLDDWLGDKPENQEVLEPLANNLTDKVYELVVDKNTDVKEEVISLTKEFIKEIAPLEKLIGQEAEDKIMDLVEDLVGKWLIK